MTALESLACSYRELRSRSLPPSLHDLRLTRCVLTGAADFSHLTALRLLHYCGARISSGSTLTMPPSLEELDVSESEDITAPLAHLSRLRVLRATRIRLYREVLSSLPPSLALLDVSRCAGLTARASFAHLRALTTLIAASTKLGDAALATLPPSLLALDVSKCNHLTAAALFPPLPALRQLNASDTALGDVAVASMPRGLVELRMLHCMGVTPRVSMDHLTALRTLFSLGTAVPPATLTALRARGCVAPMDGVLRGHDGKVTSLAVLASGLLASGGDDGTVRLWGTARGGQAVELLHEERSTNVLSLAALPDGRRVAIGTGDGALVVRNTGVATRAGHGAAGVTIDCGSCDVYCLAVLNDGRVAVADASDDGVFVVDPDAGEEGPVILKADAWAMAVLHNGLLAVGTDHNTVDLWDVGKKSCVATLVGPDKEPSSDINSLAVLVDGRLAASDSNGTVCLWDVDTLTCGAALDCNDVVALTALPDGRLATGSQDGTIRVWDSRPTAHGGAASSRPAAAPIAAVAPVLEGHTAAINALAPLPGGRLASASRDGTVRLWVLPPLSPI